MQRFIAARLTRLVFLLAGPTLVVGSTGCMSCVRRAARITPIRDHLETYVIVAVGHKSCCPIPWTDKPTVVNKGSAVSFWIRAVHPDNLFVPYPYKTIAYTLTNQFGGAVQSGAEFSGSVETDGQGYAMLTSYFSPVVGSYRLKVDYDDRELKGSTLSVPIVVK